MIFYVQIDSLHTIQDYIDFFLGSLANIPIMSSYYNFTKQFSLLTYNKFTI